MVFSKEYFIATDERKRSFLYGLVGFGLGVVIGIKATNTFTVIFNRCNFMGICKTGKCASTSKCQNLKKTVFPPWI